MEKDKLPALTTALKTTQAASRWTLNSKARRHDLLQSLSQKVISPGTAGPSLSTSASAGALAKEESEREKRAAKEVAKAEANRLRKATMLNEENVHAVARRCEILKNRNYKAKVARGELGLGRSPERKHDDTTISAQMSRRTTVPPELKELPQFSFDYQAAYKRLGSHTRARKAAIEAKAKFEEMVLQQIRENKESLAEERKAVHDARRFVSQGLPEHHTTFNPVLKSKELAYGKGRVKGKMKSLTPIKGKGELLSSSDPSVKGPMRPQKVSEALHRSFVTGKFVMLSQGVTAIPGNELRSLPVPLLCSLKSLRELDIAHNKVRELPADFGRVHTLESLRLSYNRLKKLPSSITSMSNLVELGLSGNGLTILPQRFGMLKRLRILEVDNNFLPFLPGTFDRLRKLEVLNASRNKLLAFAVINILEVEDLGSADDWKEVVDGDGNKIFFNAKTGQSRRTLPSHKLKRDGYRYVADENEEDLDDDYGWNTPKTIGTGAGEGRGGFEPGMETPQSLRKKSMSLDLSKVRKESTPAERKIDKELQAKTAMERRAEIAQRGGTEWDIVQDAKTGTLLYRNNITLKAQHSFPRDLARVVSLKRLKRLQINLNGMSALPPGIGHLKRLEVLELEFNHLMELPDSIGDCGKLRSLTLGNNLLQLLPESIGKLSELEVLKLDSNRLVRLPLTVSGLTSIKAIHLGNNRLKALPSVFGYLTTLEDLRVDNNPLDFPAPHDVKKGIKSILWACRKQHNIETRGKPPEIKILRQGINGEHHVPDKTHNKAINNKIIAAEKTGILNLHWQGLTDLPARTYRLLHLKELRLIGHKFTRVPKAFRRFSELTIMNLAGNNIEEIPEEVFKETPLLEQLVLQENKLTTLPKSITYLRRLNILRISNNKLSTLPFEIGRMKALTELFMENNKLEKLPDGICDLFCLAVFMITSNELKEIPGRFHKLKGLKKFYASKNQLARLPENFGELPNLEELRLANNKIVALPNNLGSSPRDVFGLKQDSSSSVAKDTTSASSSAAAAAAAAGQMLSGAVTSALLGAHKMVSSVEEPEGKVNANGGPTSWDVMGMLYKAAGSFHSNIDKTSARDAGFQHTQGTESSKDSNDEESVGPVLNLLSTAMFDDPVQRKRTITSRRHTLMQRKVSQRATRGRVRFFDLAEDFGAIVEDHEEGEAEVDGGEEEDDDGFDGAYEGEEDVDDDGDGDGDDEDDDEEEDEESERQRETERRAEKKQKQMDRIRRKTQLLKPTEAELAHDGGWKDLVRNIVQTEMAVLRQPSPLALSLKCLWLDSNMLEELPESFQNFQGLGAVQIENNPMRSPPAEIAVRGPVALAKYCKLRVERMHKTKAAFKAADIKFQEQLLAPTAKAFLLPESLKYLEDDDVEQLEEAVDKFLNGRFYAHPLQIEDIVDNFLDLKAMRTRSFYYSAINQFIDLLVEIKEQNLLPEDLFEFEASRPWGEMASEVDVFAFTLDDIFKDRDGRPSIISLLATNKKLGYGSFDFQLTREQVEEVLREFEGPYGRVCEIEVEYPFKVCNCVDEETGAKLSEFDRCTVEKGGCKRPAWVVQKLVFTDEEAERKEDEEIESEERAAMAVEDLEEFFETAEGQEELADEVERQRIKLKNRIGDLKAEIAETANEIRKLQEDMAALKKRKALFLQGENIQLHRFRSVEETDAAIKEIDEKIEKCRTADHDAKEEIKQHSGILATSRDKRKEHAKGEIELREAKEARKKVLEDRRREARSAGLRRPWDGKNGREFEKWKISHADDSDSDSDEDGEGYRREGDDEDDDEEEGEESGG